MASALKVEVPPLPRSSSDRLPVGMLSKVGIFHNPSQTAFDTSIEVHMLQRDKGLVVIFDQSHQGGDVRSIKEILQGTPKAGMLGSGDADELNGISGRSAFSGHDYYHLNSDSWYVSWDYSGQTALDRIRVRVFSVVGSSGAGEVVRDRGGVLTVLGEFDSDTGSTDADAEVTVVLSDTVIAGDKIRIRRKAGELGVRLQWFFAYSDSETPTEESDFLVLDGVAITAASSSLEWAYRVAPDGEDDTSFAGNIAHQSPHRDVNVSEKWMIDGTETDPFIKGLTRAEVQIIRSANIAYNNTRDLHAYYTMTTSFTFGGIHCNHVFKVREECDFPVAYVAMLPAVPTFTTAVSDGETLQLDSTSGTVTFADKTNNVVMNSTPSGDSLRMRCSETLKAFIIRNPSYDKLYFEMNPGDVEFGYKLDVSWLLAIE